MDNKSNEYNISDNVNDSFAFQVFGLKYEMRYPLAEEVENIQKVSDQLQEAQDDKERAEEAKELSKKLENEVYEFITPVGHEAPIKETLKRANIRVMRNFNKMIKTELSIS